MQASAYRASAAFLVAAGAGAAVWARSPLLAGRAEPWDAENFYYAIALATAGAVAGILAPRPFWAVYLGGIAGQTLYEAVCIGIGPLFPIGMGFMLVYTLLFLGSALLAGRLRRAILGGS